MASSAVEEIKERLTIDEVVGGYVKLVRAGSYFKGVCPFHKEKTPSFFVSPDRGTFYCFGCGAKGDIFSFVEQFEGVGFPQALSMLGARAGVEVEKQDPREQEHRSHLSEVLEEATKIFERNLAAAPDVRGYIANRGLTPATVSTWRLGWAPSGWRNLHDELIAKGYEEKLLQEVGLTKRREGDTAHEGESSSYDRFRSRIIFPIFNASGSVVGFSGRLFGETPDDSPEAPKYLNSPETPLFNKSRILYGFDRAKLSVRKYNCSIVVEGQMDLLASHQAGFTNTVALSGTALTVQQLEMLKRLSPNVVLALDADAAGIASAGKSAKLALSLGMNVKVAALPSGVDPAELVKEGKDGLRQAIRSATHIVDFYLDILARASYDSRTFRLKVQELVLPFIRSIENKIDQAHFVGVVAGRLSIPEEAVWEELKKIPREERKEVSGETKPGVAVVVRAPLSRSERILRSLRDLVLWQGNLPEPRVDVEKFRAAIDKLATTYGLSTGEEEDEAEVSFRAEASFGTVVDLDSEIDDLLRRLEEEILRGKLLEAMHQLKEAEATGDETATHELLETCKRLSDTIRGLERPTAK